jgi:hypothetical protein
MPRVLHCAYDCDGEGCDERACVTEHAINLSTQQALKCVGTTLVRVCVVHRRVVVCACCGNAQACFSDGPRTMEQKGGLDFHPGYRALTADAAQALGRKVHAQAGDHDQFHPCLTARLCATCRKAASNAKNAKATTAAAAAQRKEAERVRAAAALAARRPQQPSNSAAPASTANCALRSTAEASRAGPEEGMRRSARAQGRVRLLVLCI